VKKKTRARKTKTASRAKKPTARTRKVAEPASEIDLTSIERLVDLMSQNDLVEVEVLYGADKKIRLSRRDTTAHLRENPVVLHDVRSAAPMAHAAPSPDVGIAPQAGASEGDGESVEFVSPMVGTFYRAASPELPPYVTTGDKVSPDTVVCIIEAMKVMNEIKAEMAGEIVDILVENGEAIEYGQPLFLIRKTG